MLFRSAKNRPRRYGNERGVALLIVLLVTALLIALIFEFSYATRISLNNAVNFRDSQRAYFLAQAGINAFKKNGPMLRELIPQGEWHPVPMVIEGDTTIMVKWEDESGKIKINNVKTDPITQSMVSKLLENKGIDRNVYDRMIASNSEINNLTLLSGLRQYMNDEEFGKLNVYDNFTVSPVAQDKININAASADVLCSLGITADAAALMIQNRTGKAYTEEDISSDRIGAISGLKIPPATGNYVKTYVTTTAGTIFKVSAYATVGGYTKQVEAIVNGSAISYWRAL